MAVVGLIRATWLGGPSSPGVTTIAFQDSGTGDHAAAAAAVRTMIASQAAAIPDEYTIQVENQIELYSDTDAGIIGSVTLGVADTPAVIAGTFAGAYLHGAGCRVDWQTSSIRNRRRVSGRTYIVPFAPAAFDTEGKLSQATVNSLGNAAQTMLSTMSQAGLPMVVWSRPSVASPVGQMSPVIAAQVPTKAATLRGRRD